MSLLTTAPLGLYFRVCGEGFKVSPISLLSQSLLGYLNFLCFLNSIDTDTDDDNSVAIWLKNDGSNQMDPMYSNLETTTPQDEGCT